MYKYIIFDLGGVLIDWNPRYLYRNLFENEDEMEHFLSEICTLEWNEMQDGGRSLQDGTAILINQFPKYGELIAAYYDRWPEMLADSISETEALLHQFAKRSDIEIFALTNWSAETFPIAQEKFKFLELFKGIVVSGTEKLKKPDPKIYQLLLSRYDLQARQCIFIDDNLRNIRAAETLGICGIHYQDPSTLVHELTKLNIL